MLDSPLPQPAHPVDADATRRAFLKKVAVGGAAAAVGTQLLPLRAFAQEEGEDGEGAGGDDPTSDTTAPGTEQESEEPVELTPDEERVTFLAGIALAGATIYRAAAGDEGTGGEEDEEEGSTPSSTTTTLPPITVPALAEPVVEVLRVFGSHHSQQAVGLNGLLTTAVAAPNGTLVAEGRGALATATDEAAVLTLLRDLEERIAATHLQAVADMEDANDAKLVATTLPVIGQHAAVLGLIGTTPAPLEELVPEEQTTDGALDEATYPADGTTAPEDVPGTSGADEPESSGGGEGADPDTGTAPNPDDGTEQGGGGATGGGSTDSGGGADDPESEG